MNSSAALAVSGANGNTAASRAADSKNVERLDRIPSIFGVLFSFFNTFTHLSQFFFGQRVLVSMNKKHIQPILLRVYHIFPKKSTTKTVGEAIFLRPNGSFH